jgi:hypothetical protein
MKKDCRLGYRVSMVKAVVAACLFLLAVTVAQATVRIVSDPGGEIGSYRAKLYALRESGERVIIDGPCLSACTMILGIIPPDRLCVTPRAKFGFHAAFTLRNGKHVFDKAATQLVLDTYPEPVRLWLKKHGGLSRKLLFLSGPELTAVYPLCAEHSR